MEIQATESLSMFYLPLFLSSPLISFSNACSSSLVTPIFSSDRAKVLLVGAVAQVAVRQSRQQQPLVTTNLPTGIPTERCHVSNLCFTYVSSCIPWKVAAGKQSCVLKSELCTLFCSHAGKRLPLLRAMCAQLNSLSSVFQWSSCVCVCMYVSGIMVWPWVLLILHVARKCCVTS